MGIGLDGQPFVLDDDDSHFEGGGASGSYYMQQQSPKKRGRKKKLDFNGLENQEQDRPIVKRPRTAYSLFAHQVCIAQTRHVFSLPRHTYSVLGDPALGSAHNCLVVFVATGTRLSVRHKVRRHAAGNGAVLGPEVEEHGCG